jgi:hypothetical protein
MFIAALFTIAKLWKQPRYPTTFEWFKRTSYLYTMKFYSAIKKNEILNICKWMEVENIILSELSQVQKVQSHMFSHIWIIGPIQMQAVLWKTGPTKGSSPMGEGG